MNDKMMIDRQYNDVVMAISIGNGDVDKGNGDVEKGNGDGDEGDCDADHDNGEYDTRRRIKYIQRYINE